MERVVHKARSFEEAARHDREQQLAMTVEERRELVHALRLRVHGPDPIDVRAYERSKGR